LYRPAGIGAKVEKCGKKRKLEKKFRRMGFSPLPKTQISGYATVNQSINGEIYTAPQTANGRN